MNSLVSTGVLTFLFASPYNLSENTYVRWGKKNIQKNILQWGWRNVMHLSALNEVNAEFIIDQN